MTRACPYPLVSRLTWVSSDLAAVAFDAVLVEVLPWSARMAEAMLRLTSSSSRRPVLFGPRSYLRPATTTVEVIAASLRRWPVGFFGGPPEPPKALAVPRP